MTAAMCFAVIVERILKIRVSSMFHTFPSRLWRRMKSEKHESSATEQASHTQK